MSLENESISSIVDTSIPERIVDGIRVLNERVFPDKPKVIFDPILGGIILPEEVVIQFARDLIHARNYENIRRGMIVGGYIGNASLDSPLPFAFALGAFGCAQLEKRSFESVLKTADTVWNLFDLDASPLYRGIETNKALLADEIKREDNKIDLFVPLERLLALDDRRGAFREELSTLKQEINRSVLTLTGASLAARLSVLLAVPFVLYHLSLSDSVRETTNNMRSLIEELITGSSIAQIVYSNPQDRPS